jgi:hypothetical protein
VSRKRVAILTHEDLVPPDDVSSLSEQEFLKIKREWGVADTLVKSRHIVRFIGVSHDLMPIRRMVEEWHPDVLFNLLMEFQDVGPYQVHVTAYLELLNTAYTGCNPTCSTPPTPAATPPASCSPATRPSPRRSCATTASPRRPSPCTAAGAPRGRGATCPSR